MAALDDTYGAFLIGVVVATMLYGCSCIQTWYYYNHYPLDRWYIKLLVAVVLFLDTCHQVLITHALYRYLITYFGNLEELDKLLLSPIIAVYFNGFTTLFVQCFFAMRVYRLSRKNWLATSSVIIVVIAQFVMVLVYATKALLFKTFVQMAALKTLTITINVITAAGDLFIAVLLCSLLQGSRTGFRRSDTMINQLIMFTINTGLLTSFCVIGSLVCISAWPQTFVYMTFYLSIGRLYCNSLFATLNAREGLRTESHNDDISLTRATQSRVNHSFLGTSSKRTPNNISIKIETIREYTGEEHSSSSAELKNSEVV